MALDALTFGYPTQARKHAAAAVRLSPGDPRPWYLMATAVVGQRSAPLASRRVPRAWVAASSGVYADTAKGLVTRRRALTPLLLLLVATSRSSGDDASIVRRPTLSATQWRCVPRRGGSSPTTTAQQTARQDHDDYAITV